MNLKYYSSVYKGNINVYDVSKLQSYDCPYSALKAANDEWNSYPDNHIARLLVIIRQHENNDEITSNNFAYFQFHNSQSCIDYIEKHTEFTWSAPENQFWNGNAKLMG